MTRLFREEGCHQLMDSDEATGPHLPYHMQLTTGHKVGLAIMVSVLVAVAAMVALRVANEDVIWQDVGYDTSSSTDVELTWQVTRREAVAVACTLHARNMRQVVVGTHDVQLPAAPGGTTEHTARFATTEPATHVTVVNCRPSSDASR